MSEAGQKVAIVTGGSQGIGAGLVEGYRQRGWAVVANSLHIKPSQDPDVLTVQGDISEQATADQIISQTIDRFGRVDTLVNNAGVFVSKPFTDYTAADYALRGSVTSFPRSAASARSAMSWRVCCSWSPRPLSPGRSCTSTAARPLATRPGALVARAARGPLRPR